MLRGLDMGHSGAVPRCPWPLSPGCCELSPHTGTPGSLFAKKRGQRKSKILLWGHLHPAHTQCKGSGEAGIRGPKDTQNRKMLTLQMVWQ